jgi:diaminohydroxyphosphoribosylaminopyrimidine deaminase/5-amino-6-(5-phosphoribosylamino)uracil reductase
MRIHSKFMRRAYRLACLGTGRASPNPMVGAVVARDGRIVGQGTHVYAGRDHAERLALAQAGEAARGADLYITLEPCSHHGRTPPCAEAVAAAGIRRVFCGMVDPNPLVAGTGLEYLRRHEVAVYLEEDPEPYRQLNRAFVRFITTGRPWVVLKAALSLDGRIAPGAGPARWVTGERARAEGHRLRYRCDAILAGIGTVLADDPALTCRTRRTRPVPLRRLVLDAALRTPPDAQLVQTAAEVPLEIFCAPEADPDRRRVLEASGVTVTELPLQPAHTPPMAGDLATVDPAVQTSRGRCLSLEALLAHLGRMRITSLLVEGGREVLTEFVRQGLADEACLFLAPKLYGDRGVALLGDLGSTTTECAPRLEVAEVRRLGPDILLHAYFLPGKTSPQRHEEHKG